MVLTAACSARPPVITANAPGATRSQQASGARASQPGRAANNATGDGGSAAAGGSSSSTSHHALPSALAIDDDAGVGSNTYLYLNRRVPKLLIEILAVSGYRPAPSALDMLRTRLSSVVDKPGGIDVLPVRTISEQHDTWTVAQLRAAEEKTSRSASSASAMVLHVMYVNGGFDDGSGGSGALGAAFSSSAFVIFKDRIADASTPLVPPDAIENADIVHETGHVLALVNIGYHSPRNHEDPDHPHHSSNPSSVMYYAIDNVGVVNLLGGHVRPPTDFDSDDRADLQDLKTGKLK